MKKPLYIDLTQLEPVDELDDGEHELHQALINGATKSIDSPEIRLVYAEIFEALKRQNS